VESARSVVRQASQGSWLVFRLGRCVLCASVFDVEGIIPRPEGIVRFPLMPGHALGAFLFRGRSAAAISLRKRLKLREGEDSSTGPFVVAQVRGAPVAFWVDEVTDVIAEADAEWHPVPAMLEGEVFERFAVRGGELIVQTTFAALLEARVDVATLSAWVAKETGVQVMPAADTAPPAVVVPTVVLPAAVLPAPEALPRAVEAPPRPTVTARVRKSPGRSNVRPIAPRPVLIAPVPSKAPAPESDRPERIFRDEVKTSANRYWLAAAALVLAVAVVPVVVNWRGPTPEREAPPVSVAVLPVAAPVSAERVNSAPPVPVERGEVTLTIHRPGEAVAPGGRVHVVVQGDTLWGIAKTYVGDPFQYPELAKYSDIRNPHLIHPGDTIRIEVRQRVPR
jgi:chemotaxis signal transduction protein/LysM repeat protein